MSTGLFLSTRVRRGIQSAEILFLVVYKKTACCLSFWLNKMAFQNAVINMP